MARRARLQAARQWLRTYRGKKVVRGYAKWFGVDLGCSLRELQLLGAALDPVYVERLSVTLQNRARPKASRKTALPAVPEGYGIEWDDDYACVAGFTSGGAAFGVTWQEAATLDAERAPTVSDEEREPDSVPF